MKKPFRFLRSALLPGAASLLAVSLFAAEPSADTRAGRLDQAVHLTPEQKAQVVAIFTAEQAQIAKLRGGGRGPSEETIEARQTARDRIRALLTPEQQKIYDRTPQMSGGGLNIPTPETRLTTFEQSTPLTPEQRRIALMIFEEEFESLVAIPPAERPNKGAPYRQAAQRQLRDLLSQDQRSSLDDKRTAAQAEAAKERAAIETALRAASGLTARVGPILRLQQQGGSTITDGKSGAMKSTATYRVVGDKATETITASWEATRGSDTVKLTKIATATGEAIPF